MSTCLSRTLAERSRQPWDGYHHAQHIQSQLTIKMVNGECRRRDETRTSDITTGREGLADTGAYDNPAQFRTIPLLEG
jgi:hypothetical protein